MEKNLGYFRKAASSRIRNDLQEGRKEFARKFIVTLSQLADHNHIVGKVKFLKSLKAKQDQNC